MKASIKAFSVQNPGIPSSVTRLLLLAVAGVSDANCHHLFLDLHSAYDDIILGEDDEIGEDRSLQSCCEGIDKQTQSEPDNFPFN
jgi:hypothetical protein